MIIVAPDLSGQTYKPRGTSLRKFMYFCLSPFIKNNDIDGLAKRLDTLMAIGNGFYSDITPEMIFSLLEWSSRSDFAEKQCVLIESSVSTHSPRLLKLLLTDDHVRKNASCYLVFMSIAEASSINANFLQILGVAIDAWTAVFDENRLLFKQVWSSFIQRTLDYGTPKNISALFRTHASRMEWKNIVSVAITHRHCETLEKVLVGIIRDFACQKPQTFNYADILRVSETSSTFDTYMGIRCLSSFTTPPNREDGIDDGKYAPIFCLPPNESHMDLSSTCVGRWRFCNYCKKQIQNEMGFNIV